MGEQRKSNFELKLESYAAAKKKPKAEFQRELLIWVLNGIHMARLSIRKHVQKSSRTTLAIERLLRVGPPTGMVDDAYRYIKKQLNRYGGYVTTKKNEKWKPVVFAGKRYIKLVMVVRNLPGIDIAAVEERLGKERRLRKQFEGAARARPKIPQDLRPQF